MEALYSWIQANGAVLLLAAAVVIGARMLAGRRPVPGLPAGPPPSLFGGFLQKVEESGRGAFEVMLGTRLAEGYARENHSRFFNALDGLPPQDASRKPSGEK